MNPSRSRLRSVQAGYTLIEIILVLGIISLLLGAGIKYGVGFLDFGRETRVSSDLATLTAAIKQYEMRNMFPPATDQGLAALVTKPSGEPTPAHWAQCMEKILTDPWGHPYAYRQPGKHNPKGFDVYSLGADNMDGTEDDMGNWDK